MAALEIGTDIEAEALRRFAREEADGRVASRLLAIANALSGMSREAAAKAAGMDRQTSRDWVVRCNAEGIAGLSDRPRSGRRPLLDEGGQAASKALVLRGPDPEKDGVSTWRVVDICRLCEERFGVVCSETGMPQVPHGLGLSWRKIRPRHPQADPKAQRAFKKGGSPKP